MALQDAVVQALRLLRAHKLRAALTLFGSAFVALAVFLWKRDWAVATTERVVGVLSPKLADFLAESEVEIPFSSEAPRLGGADAPVTLVVFSDFECPHCARIARFVA